MQCFEIWVNIVIFRFSDIAISVRNFMVVNETGIQQTYSFNITILSLAAEDSIVAISLLENCQFIEYTIFMVVK